MNGNLSNEQQKRRFAERIDDKAATAVDDASGIGWVGGTERKILEDIDLQDEAQEIKDLIQHHGTTGRKLA